MNKKIMTLALTSLLCSSVLSSAFCDEALNSSQEHVAVAERSMDAANRAKMKNKREELSEKDARAQEEYRTPAIQHRKESQSRNMGQKKEFVFSNYQSNAHHWLISANYDGSIVELEDGSHWKIAANYSAANWKVSDPITITPNYSFLSEYNYYIVNKFTGAYIPADIMIGPVAFGPYTHWVIGVDYDRGHVYLENGSTWIISPVDAFVFNDWAINDTVIIGSNDSWFSSFDSILINVNMNNFVRSKKY